MIFTNSFNQAILIDNHGIIQYIGSDIKLFGAFFTNYPIKLGQQVFDIVDDKFIPQFKIAIEQASQQQISVFTLRTNNNVNNQLTIVINVFRPINSHDYYYVLEVHNPIPQIEHSLKNTDKLLLLEPLFNQSYDIIFTTNLSGKLLDINQAGIDRFGISRLELLKQSIQKLFFSNRLNNFISDILNHTEYELRVNYLAKDRVKHIAELKGKLINDESSILFIAKDISVAKLEQLKLVKRLIHSEEQRRSSVAYQLYDGIGPSLSALKWYIHNLANTTNNAEKEELYKQSNNLIEEVIVRLNAISENISPHILKNFGIKPALKNRLIRFQKEYNCKIDFISDVTVRFSNEFEMGIYRIVENLITDLILTCKPEKFIVKLIRKNVELTLSIQFLEDKTQNLNISHITINEVVVAYKNQISILLGTYTIYDIPGAWKVDFVFENDNFNK